MSEQKSVELPKDDWFPQTDSEKDSVRRELKKILRDPLFHASKRYPSFLNYIVEETIEGRGEQLKERILGIEVFGRKADYDCSLDNIVRATAIETRKRLAEYYARVDRKSEIRIDLVVGSYVPKFFKEVPSAEPHPRRLWPHAGLSLLVVLILGVIGVFGWRMLHVPDDPLTLFWRPFLDWNGSLSLCIGSDGWPGSLTSQNVTDSDSAAAAQTLQSDDPSIRFSTAVHLARFVQFLGSRAKTFRILHDSSVSLHNLRDGPSILIGINTWAIRLTEPLRFSIKWDPATQMVWISDRQNPSRRDWANSLAITSGGQWKDYALISHFVNPTTGQWVAVVSGLHRFGTRASAELLLNRESMRLLAAKAPQDWDQMNLQFIIATEVIQGAHGQPRIVESYFWRR